jgi:uncharacterized protein (DUF983 family)
MAETLVLAENEALCPACGEIIYKRFVEVNGRCPVCPKSLRLVKGQAVLVAKKRWP